MSITDFLLARIAEDEAVARAAIEPDQMHPYGDKKLPRVKVSDVPDEVRGYLGGSWGEHFARHDPARVLAECAAKRAIVEMHAPVDYSGLGMESPNACTLCGADRGMHDWEWMKDSFPCDTLRTLAAVYAEHPAYLDEWRAGHD